MSSDIEPQSAIAAIGLCDDTKAFVYIRLPNDTTAVSGRVRGPFSAFATTLPGNFPLALVPGRDGPLAGAWVTDPCAWSPEQPLLYRVEYVLERRGHPAQHYAGEVAIRRLAPRGKHLFFSGKRWVLRAVDAQRWPGEVENWKDQASGVVVSRIDAEQAQAAATHGLVLVRRIADWSDPELDTLAACTAVCIALIECEPPIDVATRWPNILRAQQLRITDDLQPWAQLAWVSSDDTEVVRQANLRLEVPIVVERSPTGSSLGEARSLIDQLQADLAPIGQFAGYVV
jgi:hypothetical protein